ncbi:MAG TPA: MmgE/PrpD family protein [candidate division Zixibacteria bacterium]|nr:MmgE/PrpD family protein [candidate division Zixibacteria bacterium]
MENTLSKQMAKFAIGLKYSDLPENVVHEVKRFLYDSVGCAFGGYHTKDLNILRDIYKDMAGKGEATLIGFGDKIPAVNATLVNSLMVRALDFNDIYWKEDPSHPSDIIPAALAVGEMVSSSMEEVIVAIVLAYEFEMRMCLFATPGVRERKWHHATLTQFVSPIVAGKLMGLTEDEMVNAIGISGCHNHTIGCPTAGKLTMMKNTVDPMAVQSGVFAALMAQKGYTGTEAVIEGKEGFKDCFGEGWDDEALVGNLGKDFKIIECSMKAFPTEALTHTHISAALTVMQKNNLTYKDVAEVSVTTIARACDILFDPHKYRPESRETADHSLPYCIASAIVDGKITTNSFSEEKMKGPAIWETIDKIKGVASEEFEAMFPAKQPSKVVVKTTKGDSFEAYLEYPKGDPREPMTQDDLDAKFNSLTDQLLDVTRQAEMKKTIFNCETMSCQDFMAKLVV